MATRRMMYITPPPEPLNKLDTRLQKIEKARLSVLSYRLLAQSKSVQTKFPYRTTGVLNWTHRSQNILKELKAYDATVLCLQDLDNYDVWWQPQLAALGYDSVFAKCDNDRREGVAIFYKREELNVFRSHVVHLNETADAITESRQKMRVRTGDVGLVLMLSPYEASTIPTALCIVSASLPEDGDMDDVRDWQARHLFRSVELFNADFCLPIIVGASVFSTPRSSLYHLITQGFPRVDPEPPEAPKKPTIDVMSMASVRVSWTPPNPGDAPIRKYRVDRMTGRNTEAGFIACCFAPSSVSEVVLTGLSSGMQYRFRVAAISSIGCAVSPPSAWVTTPESVKAAVRMHELKIEVDEDDPSDVLAAGLGKGSPTKLVHPPTGLTPRFENGAVNQVAASMPLSPPAGKPRIKVTASEGQLGYSPMSDGRTSVYSEASFGKEEALAVAAVFDTLYDRDGSPADDRTTVSYASSAMVVDRPGLTILTAQGTKPTVVTRISGKFGADGDLDGDDFLEEYALDKMVVDIDDDGLRKYSCAAMCKSRHIGRIHRYCDLAARAGLLEQQDALVWNGNLICQPIRPPALASKGPPESSVKAIEASAAFASLGEVSLGSYTEGDGKLELDDEEDDGIPAEDDKVIDDVGPGELQEASLESVAKPVEKSPTHISHHVQFATKAVSVEESQISVAPDWFSSLGVGEPPYTMATQKLQGCVDYIWFTPGAVVLSGVLSLPPRSAVEGLLPTREYSSDHIAILSEFRFEPSCLSADW